MDYFEGRGYWSTMSCIPNKIKDPEHKPHVWDSEYCMYGPYLCPGFQYVGKHRAKEDSHVR